MARSFLARLFGGAAVLAGGCAETSPPPPPPPPPPAPPAPAPATPEARITTALQGLLARNDDPFAVIEHAESGKFVQFVGSSGDPLLLDLPFQALSPEELPRAEDLMISLGGARVEDVFQLQMGRDAGEAARVALRVFREVYQLPEDVELVVSVESGAE